MLDRVRVVRSRPERQALRVPVPAGVPARARDVARPRRAVLVDAERLAAEQGARLRRRRGPGIAGAHEQRAGARLEAHPAPVMEDRMRQTAHDDVPVADACTGRREDVEVEPYDAVVGRGGVAREHVLVGRAVVPGAERDAHEAAFTAVVERTVERRHRTQHAGRLSVADPGIEET